MSLMLEIPDSVTCTLRLLRQASDEAQAAEQKADNECKPQPGNCYLSATKTEF